MAVRLLLLSTEIKDGGNYLLLQSKATMAVDCGGSRNRHLYNYNVGRGGSLVDSSPFVRRVVGSNPALATKNKDLGQVLHSQLSVAHRRELQYPRCVGSASE